jgi:hypothetical protein
VFDIQLDAAIYSWGLFAAASQRGLVRGMLAAHGVFPLLLNIVTTLVTRGPQAR